MLSEELKSLGLSDAHMDAYGYVYATIPSNSKKALPVVSFCSHVDTAPDCSGTNVKPIVHLCYDGQPIVLPDDHAQVVDPDRNPYLKLKKGDDIITASGLTLLGADDKSGLAIIMDLVQYLHSYLLADLDTQSGPNAVLKERVARGDLGAKTGKGFYDWSTKSAADVIKARDTELLERARKRKAR